MDEFLVFDVQASGDKVLVAKCGSKEEALQKCGALEAPSLEHATDLGTEVLFSRARGQD